jgi:hypothetical protein
VDTAFLEWLAQGALGPAVVALPVNWSASQIAAAARRWFGRLRRADSLSRLLKAAGASAKLTADEFGDLRRLLENPETWEQIGRGAGLELTGAISAQLRSWGRGEGDAALTAEAIAYGFLDFVAADLEPKLFQQVLLARLHRMESGLVSSTDNALAILHADLVAQFASQNEHSDPQFAAIIHQLGEAIDKLPPGPAGRAEISVYLAALISWLNQDPWPRDRRFQGPKLTPAAIERKLRVTTLNAIPQRRLMGKSQRLHQDQLIELHLPADELASKCKRLVVLGGPGSGKTWLAKRTARLCAELALRRLADGADLGDIELPLYTTCSLLAGEVGDIRNAVVSSSLNQLGDLGGSRTSTALRSFFTERNAPTLLVIDSVDEAQRPDHRLRQADSLPWRIVLTSRPTSWNQQLDLGDGEPDPARQVGNLLPLSYPYDVEPFIRRWFEQDPVRARLLVRQLASRPDLQQSATVPLLLAFYCIIGGDQALPETRRELYARVLSRLLTGRWRRGGDSPDPVACTEVLRSWAWAGAISDPLSEVGAWQDEIPTPRAFMPEADREAVDHVASPLAPEDLDTLTTQRRFMHRALREHLVAEYVAALSPHQASREILAHLWYDPDWEYAAPAALAMHPRRGEILRHLIAALPRPENRKGDILPIESCWGIWKFLARVSLESDERDWMADAKAAELIALARLHCFTPHRLASTGSGGLSVGSDWPSCDSEIRRRVLTALAGTRDAESARALSLALFRLRPEPAELIRARQLLGALLSTVPRDARQLAQTLTELGAAPDEVVATKRLILRMLANTPWHALELVQALGTLEPNADELVQARRSVLTLLCSTPVRAHELAKALTRLNPHPDEISKARETILAALTNGGPGIALRLLEALEWLSAEGDSITEIHILLLKQLEHAELAWDVREIAEALGKLDIRATFRAQVCQVILARLSATTDVSQIDILIQGLAALVPTQAARAGTWAEVLVSVIRDANWHRMFGLASMLGALESNAVASSQLRVLLLAMVNELVHKDMLHSLYELLSGLEPQAAELASARASLLKSLARTRDSRRALELALVLTTLEPGPLDLESARNRILSLLCATHYSSDDVRNFAEALFNLQASPGELELARTAVLALLARRDVYAGTDSLVQALGYLRPALDDTGRARQAVIKRLTMSKSAEEAQSLAQIVAQMNPQPEELGECRHVLLRWLPKLSSLNSTHDQILKTLVQLKPDIATLDSWRTWNARPSSELLAAVRNNSSLSDWLAALLSFPDPDDQEVTQT